MNKHLRNLILSVTEASDLFDLEAIQTLWSGYGSIDRYGLTGSKLQSVVVKHVRLPKQSNHPRGWNSDLSHQRKLTSYQVETAWYEHWASRCPNVCRIPHCFAVEHYDDEVWMVLEDLDSSGYAGRKNWADQEDINICLRWLAYFHANFMQEQPEGLWPIGTYWHLATRPDEWNAMAEGELKQAAAELDQILNQTPFQTLVHGDAKLANFCFSDDGQSVAAVDFQYVGGGCGMKDVVYFISSCLGEDECAQQQDDLLELYFAFLRQALLELNPKLDVDAVETAWRPLYAVAWADFYRFLQGWSPSHWKINRYSESLSREVLANLQVYL